MRASDFEITDQDQLDEILVGLCELVIQGQTKGQDLGMVAAAVLDPELNCVVGINYPTRSGRRALASLGIRINSISDVTPIPHNGCRPQKRRRI
jgi:ribosomal protein S11